MKESMIKFLLELYEEGKATEEQRRLVEAYLEQRQREPGPEATGDKDPEASLDAILEKIRQVRAVEQMPVEEPEEAPVYSIGRTRRGYAWVAAAASVVLLVAAGIWWKQSRRTLEPAVPVVAYKTIQAGPGQQVHLLLSDSSEVWLNAGARLRYPSRFGDSLRYLELQDGEAFFKVHRDPNRSFVVQTERLRTQVLGTSFNIKAYRGSREMRVAVLTGKVSVQGMILTSDQQARYNAGTGKLTRSAVAPERSLDWQNGRFDFTDESLGDIAIELEHYFDVHIRFKYPGLEKYIVSATFPHTASLKDMLGALCLLNQNHVTQIDAQHYVIH